jgi:hypothetical protein
MTELFAVRERRSVNILSRGGFFDTTTGTGPRNGAESGRARHKTPHSPGAGSAGPQASFAPWPGAASKGTAVPGIRHRGAASGQGTP